ncbi:hypothetical protein [Pirellula sp. SH-Sr6A]|uniref:hypothetical protein n=1 Tax=Pirellula sp. SH-Sr6A TaxID=1632865 RepID=UPI0011BA88F5|nr:hypothetical protein [Pirellula sp. SH-Sr6A]
MVFRYLPILAIAAILGLSPGIPNAAAQTRVQLPNNTYPVPTTGGYPAPTAPAWGAPTAGAYPPSVLPTTPSTGFDPYFRPSSQPMFSNTPNWNLGNLFNWNTSAPVIPLGPANPGVYPNYPNPTAGTGLPTTNPWGTTPGVYPNGYPSNVYPNTTPNVLFPGTNNPPLNTNWNFNSPFGAPQGSGWWNNFWNNTSSNVNYGSNQVVRLFQGARFRHTWLSGTNGFSNSDANSIESNDTDVSLVFGIPNFLNSTRSLYIIPSYSHHLWDGPSVPGSDLPSKAFSGFLDAGWDTNPLQTLGVELGVRVGVFSDFESVSSDSIRVMGKALGRLRLTPNATAKAGVFYLDRNKIKLLPALGVLWAPNPDSRFDIFFPEPKLSHYVSTVGNTDIWWYLTGYYGGGTWTIEHTDGANDEIDINDIRVMLGLEFGRSDQIRQGFRLGFVEMGYAFDRELIYRYRPTSNLELENSIVIRAGLAY